MRPDLSQAAVMNIEKGEELFGGWATPAIAQVGIYKLLAKKKTDGTIEWAHFVQRDNGLKESVMRGTVKTPEEFTFVKDAVTKHLKKVFGVTMQEAEYDMRTFDGKKASDAKH